MRVLRVIRALSVWRCAHTHTVHGDLSSSIARREVSECKGGWHPLARVSDVPVGPRYLFYKWAMRSFAWRKSVCTGLHPAICTCMHMYVYLSVTVVRGQSRVGAADLQCGVTVETVDSQNPSSYDDCVPRVCVCVCVCVCVRATSVCACMRMRVRACARARARVSACLEGERGVRRGLRSSYAPNATTHAAHTSTSSASCWFLTANLRIIGHVTISSRALLDARISSRERRHVNSRKQLFAVLLFPSVMRKTEGGRSNGILDILFYLSMMIG